MGIKSTSDVTLEEMEKEMDRVEKEKKESEEEKEQ